MPYRPRPAKTQRIRPSRAGDPRNTARWRRLATEAVAAHIAAHGNWCPGHNVEPHPATDLTADHAIALADGGNAFPEVHELAILCSRCNASKGSRERGARPPKRGV